MMRFIILIQFFLTIKTANAQTLGGSSVFNFLRLPNTPQLTALGGVNISVQSDDVGMAFNNPSLLKSSMHTQMNTVFNDFYAGIEAYHLSFGYSHAKLKTNFAWGLMYFDYGKIAETDAAGNILGNFKPKDWVMQLSASRNYLQKWSYGMTLKFINSNYGLYRSNGVAVDAGIVYYDSTRLISASVVAKNMGVQLKKYAGAEADELPFELQAGVTVKLREAPLAFSLTAQRLHQFDLRYNDTTFNNDNGVANETGMHTFDKIFQHFVLATQVFPTQNIELSVGYNHLRRKELNIGNAGNGLNGFSVGVGVLLNKIQIRYARSHYQNNTGYNQLGLNLKLNEYFGLGKFGERIGW